MDVLDRLFDQLSRALDRDQIGRTPTVADVYQRLVPYRSVRGELGIWELAEYEHALLRLLSGEREYLHLAAEDARQEILRELASPNPILGIYRDYHAVAVDVLGSVPGDGAREGDVTLPRIETEQSVAPAGESRSCPACAAKLPDTPDLRFCPSCGTDQLALSCTECGGSLKAEWNFCIRCGTPRRQG